jgi:hypothetical protein
MKDIIRRILVEDRQEKYYDYIVNDIINNTKLYKEEGVRDEIQYPFSDEWDIDEFVIDEFPHSDMITYLRDKYGLTMDESNKVLSIYLKYIIEYFNN